VAQDERDRREKRDMDRWISTSSRPSRSSRSPILLEQPSFLKVIFVNDRGGFGGKLSPFLQQTFDIFPDQI
jgi:hypothetical protein